MTGRHKELPCKYGDVLFMDGKWGGGNKLGWPFFAICVINADGHVAMVAHGFASGESNAAYGYKLCSGSACDMCFGQVTQPTHVSFQAHPRVDGQVRSKLS